MGGRPVGIPVARRYGAKRGSGQPRLSLTQTQLAGNGNQESDSEQHESDPLDEAVNEQQDLLAEFEKVAGDLNDVLANLEGSTLVKRLKASSRRDCRRSGHSP